MKAIETRYKGYRFRSRLEARYAVFLDTLGIRWEYETEGFSLPSGLYLPDFFLPFPNRVLVGRETNVGNWNGYRGVQAYWLEIKPSYPTEEEIKLMMELAIATKHHVYCFSGSPNPSEVKIHVASVLGKWSGDWNLQWDDFPWGESQKTSCSLHGFMCNCAPDCKMDVLQGFAAARSARFEHGECG